MFNDGKNAKPTSCHSTQLRLFALLLALPFIGASYALGLFNCDKCSVICGASPAADDDTVERQSSPTTRKSSALSYDDAAPSAAATELRFVASINPLNFSFVPARLAKPYWFVFSGLSPPHKFA